MALLPKNYSLLSSVALAILTIAGMQVLKDQIAMEGNLLRLGGGGFLGSLLFVFILTAIGNLYSIIFPQNFHLRLFPEVVVSMLMAMFASAIVHRICATTCIIFSIIALYYLNKISQSRYGLSSTKPVSRGSTGAVKPSRNPSSPRASRHKSQ